MLLLLLRRGGRTNDVFKFGICVMRELVGGARAGRATPISESRRLIAHAHSLRALARARRAARLGASRRVDATAARAVRLRLSRRSGGRVNLELGGGLFFVGRVRPLDGRSGRSGDGLSHVLARARELVLTRSPFTIVAMPCSRPFESVSTCEGTPPIVVQYALNEPV